MLTEIFRKGGSFFPAACSPGYRIYQASFKDAALIRAIMETVTDTLEDKSLFIPDGQDFVERVLTSDGFGLLAADHKNTAAAYLLVPFPGLEADNLGLELDFDASRLKQVAHMDSLAVLPAHRGQHLQQSLILCAEKILDYDDRPYRMATVSPSNLPSLKNFLACGYEIRATREKYGGYIRHILLKYKVKATDSGL